MTRYQNKTLIRSRKSKERTEITMAKGKKDKQ